MPKYVRARKGNPLLTHPETGALVATNPGTPVLEDDPLVKAFPWAFLDDEELAAEQEGQARFVTEAPLEKASARPGEKRGTRRPR